MSSLPPDSYTARRLEHATPAHLHYTSRRTFVGPIPQGWLKSHRKDWFREYVLGGGGQPSFTADDHAAPDFPPQQHAPDGAAEETPRPSSQTDQSNARTQNTTTSTTSLLPRESHADSRSPVVQRPSVYDRAAERSQAPRVRFSDATRLQLRSRTQRLIAGGTFRSAKVKPGELLKMEKMLVRTDMTRQTLGTDFDERLSQGVETKTLDKWREFMVVCRKHEEGAVLQFYQTRVIASTADKTKRRPKAQLLLLEKGGGARVNMYSSLDKTLCIWNTERSVTYIYYLRPQSGATSVEWFTFLSSIMGGRPTTTLNIHVPHLNVSLRLDDPFRKDQISSTLAKAAEGDDDALLKAVSDEKGAAGAIVARCIDMLKQSPEWTDILRSWAQNDRIGLAWKRYDRLEWVHGAAEQKMYGTIAMQQTHDLELRPKHHYPLNAKTRKGKTVEEPPPVEGFLIRMTSQQGHVRRLGKMVFKRLYFTTQNQYIVFLQPSMSSPPPPPTTNMRGHGSIPSAQQIADDIPLTYDINPYPLDGGRVSWMDDLRGDGASAQEQLDLAAVTEAERNTKMLLACDGFIDMRDVTSVRKFHKGSTAVDEGLDADGSDVDFDEPIQDQLIDGETSSVEEDRVFELLLKNGLVIRLQAYNAAAKKEWVHRLRRLVKYWHHRSRADMDQFKITREENLEELRIDERAEAHVGSFAYKWEVSQSLASPILYNLCGIAACRTIHLSGILFRKPRRHSTFSRCHVLLAAGHLLIFQDSLRRRSGQKLVHIHHERIASIDLRDCYLYSGLLTEEDLLYENRTFDSNAPGRHVLPRVFLDDAWTSADEDAMTTFVIWHARSKAWFRSSHTVDDARKSERERERAAADPPSSSSLSSAAALKTRTRLERVSKLGATGRSVVFKARSRAERDQWVLAIQVEIERLAAAQREDVRLADAGQ